ncbi:MAG: hypothetical protein AAGI48_17965 [Verrucomicrobiota bacterium]
MKSPDPSTKSFKTTAFLAVVAVGWVAAIHAFAFGVFGITALAGVILVAGLAVMVGAILAYISWEFRQSKTLAKPAMVQDVSLLMLSRSSSSGRLTNKRRTRTRLSGRHPVTDRIASFHLPPHADRRQRRSTDEVRILREPVLELSSDRFPVTPSAN